MGQPLDPCARRITNESPRVGDGWSDAPAADLGHDLSRQPGAPVRPCAPEDLAGVAFVERMARDKRVLSTLNPHRAAKHDTPSQHRVRVVKAPREDDPVVAENRIFTREPEVEVDVLCVSEVEREPAGMPQYRASIHECTRASETVVRAKHVAVGVFSKTRLQPCRPALPRIENRPG